MEKNYTFTLGTAKAIEKIVDDQGKFDKLQINHVILGKGDALPVHEANANVYLIIVKGEMTASFGENPMKVYQTGEMLNISMGTQMNMSNQVDTILEFFIIKTFPVQN